MRLTWLLLSVTVLAYATFAEDEDINKVSGFAQSFLRLHRGPPELPIKSRADIITEWIDQKLDHFDANESRTWKMRYLVNNEHFKDGGPIFIYVGGEWTVSAGSISGGHFYDMAKEHNAILYYTEHRFYGQSRPLDNLTLESLKYLHVRQALADLAHFIEYQRANNPSLANSRVIMAGGSYAATMVVWFKRLYPNLLDGGWASSAPILAQVDFREYKEVVGRAVRELGSQSCYDRIENGIAGLEAMFANKRGAEVKAMFKICNNFDEYNDLDLWSLFGSISNIFSSIVQYQKEGDVPYYCNMIMNFSDDDVMAMAKFVLWAFGDPASCYDFTHKDTVAYYLDTTYARGASRPWYYQTCNEYGWYQSSSSGNQPFGSKFPVLLYTTLCENVFSSQYTNENINLNAAGTNEFFGGMVPNVTNVYMTHGALDPWHPMGHGEEQGATVIPRTSHCADFGSIATSDSAEMRASKLRIAELVREWLY